MTEEDIKKQSTSGDHLAATENTLGNNLDMLCDTVSNLKGGRIDFVLDNAVLELYCDCVYGSMVPDFLIQSGLAAQLHFRGRRVSRFVSDVIHRDWDRFLNSCVHGTLLPPASEEELASLREMGKRWKHYGEDNWVYEQHAFWCPGFTFCDLRSEVPDLFLHLSKSDLVILKGGRTTVS